MTVTYRHAGDETAGLAAGDRRWFIGAGWPAQAARPARDGDRPGGTAGPGGGGGPSGKPDPKPCPSCDAKYDVQIDPQEAVVIRVRGRTCRDCNPHWRPPPAAQGGRRRVTIVPTQPSGDAPRIKTLSENVEDKSATYLPERVISVPQRAEQSEATVRTNVAWRESVAPILSTVLTEADRHAVEQAWQPEHCEALEAVAEALDEVWATAVPMADETTVALRVVGLPAVAAALVVDVADRSTATAREPIALTGELLRFTGVVVCAGTHNAVTCGRLRHELEGIPEVPDEGMVRLLETEFARALTASMSGMTIEDFLGERGAQPERVPVVAESEPVPEVPTGPIRESIVATAPAVDGPSSPAIFGG